MIPKEKAEALVEQFHQAMYAPIGGDAYTYTHRALQCAIICCKEIIAVLENAEGECTMIHIVDYWKDVINHFESL